MTMNQLIVISEKIICRALKQVQVGAPGLA
jgi:hypothetical protein